MYVAVVCCGMPGRINVKLETGKRLQHSDQIIQILKRQIHQNLAIDHCSFICVNVDDGWQYGLVEMVPMQADIDSARCKILQDLAGNQVAACYRNIVMKCRLVAKTDQLLALQTCRPCCNRAG